MSLCNSAAQFHRVWRNLASGPVMIRRGGNGANHRGTYGESVPESGKKWEESSAKIYTDIGGPGPRNWGQLAADL